MQSLQMAPILILLLLLFGVPCWCVRTEMSIEEQISRCPPRPDLQGLFRPIPPLGRRLRVACPCIGVHTGGHAFDAMNVPEDTINAYDIEPAYYEALLHQLKASGMERIVLNLGKVAGNLMNVKLNNLETPVDILIAGPPCPPFSGQGSRQGLKDLRAQAIKFHNYNTFLFRQIAAQCRTTFHFNKAGSNCLSPSAAPLCMLLHSCMQKGPII